MTKLRQLFFAATLGSLFCLGGTPAFAQDADTPEEKAAELYKTGVEAYFAADYAVAISKFREGFDLDPNAMFLYNLSLCFSKLGNFEEALKNAEKAQQMGGMPDEVGTKNRGRLASFAVLISSEQIVAELSRPADAPQTCSTNDDCEAGYICNIRRGACVEEIGGGSNETPSEPLFTPIGWAGVGVGALGVGLTTAAIIISAGLGDDIAQHQQLVEDDDEGADALGETIRKRQSTGRILLLSGIGAVVVGGGLVVYDLFFNKTAGEESDPAVTLVPWFSPEGGGLVWRARF